MIRRVTVLLLTAAAWALVEQPARLDVVLNHSPTPEKHQIETMAGGVALLDVDNDGLQDIYFVNGASQPDLVKNDPRFHNRLYRNKGNWEFEDITDRAGVRGAGFQIGAATGDFDNDGRTDLFVSGVRSNMLYRNRVDGKFEDVTTRAGIAPGTWSVGAAWFDYDSDGDLDLFVVNYVRWDPKTEPFCGDPKGTYRTYCHPKFYEPLPNTLYRNNGDGTFTDVSKESGIGAHLGKGMAASVADYDGDGRLDVFVTNDTLGDFLFHNEGDGRFKEVGIPTGVAFNDDGLALSSMGVDFRDIDNDGRPDVFVTALANETFPLYKNLGKGLFADRTYPSRIGAATLPWSGWGTGIYDFDNDGRKDIFAANGDVNDNTEVFSSRKSRQPNLLLLSKPDGVYSPQVVGAPALHRGAAFGDIDKDGRVDVVIARLGQTPLILRNTLSTSNHWLALKLVGRKSNRDAIGTIVHLVSSEGEQWNHVTSAVGYASASDQTVHFGLGKATSAQRVEIFWPSGAKQVETDVAADRYLTVREP